MQPRFSRRTAIKATGGLGFGITSTGIFASTTIAGGHTFANELNTVRASTRKYRDVDTAKGDGYSRFGILPPVGVIFAKFPANLGNIEHTDQPSLLFYAPNRSGETEDSDLILAGVEYHVRKSNYPSGPPNIFDDENASRNLKVTESEGWHTNTVAGVDVRGLHVWVHLHNPDGVFAGPHPTIRNRLTD